MTLQGKVAIVTGGASGIGLAIARALATARARVVIADINRPASEAAVNEIRNRGGSADAIPTDVSDARSVEYLFTQIRTRHGHADILINNAGINLNRSILETEEADWEKLLDTNLSGTFRCCRAVIPDMLEKKWGRIINLASIAGLRGSAGRAAYGATKGGIVATTRAMAVELAPHAITVNAIAPGAIDTPMVAELHTDETRAAHLRRIPAARYGISEEIAHAALFLTSEQASYITGHILPVDGGFLAAGMLGAGP